MLASITTKYASFSRSVYFNIHDCGLMLLPLLMFGHDTCMLHRAGRYR